MIVKCFVQPRSFLRFLYHLKHPTYTGRMRWRALAFGLVWILSGPRLSTASDPQTGLNPDHQAALREYAAKHYKDAAESSRKAMASETPDPAGYRQSTLLLGQSLYLMGRYKESMVVLKQAPRTAET